MEVQVPSPGESVSEVDIANWLVSDGDYVEKDQTICEIDSDKATLELTAEEGGVISIKVGEGETVAVGDTVAEIDTKAEKPAGAEKKKEEPAQEKAQKAEKSEEKAPSEKEKTEQSTTSASQEKGTTPQKEGSSHAEGHPSPAAKKMMEENGVSGDRLQGTGKGGRILKQDVVNYLANGFEAGEAVQQWGGSRDSQREKMSSLRRKVSERLVSVKNETAMLTTFNEVDMSYVMDLRKKYK
ncbi:MAG: biotin/lipoyl-containing protein, partial [Flavobacteriales bacterium]